MKKISILMLLLLIPITYAATTPSPGVFAPIPKAMFLYPEEKGKFVINVDNTNSEYDSLCSFSIGGGKSQFLIDLTPQRVEVRAGEKSKIDIEVSIPLDLTPGRYIEKICANCGFSKSVCTSCQTTTVCDYVLDVTVLKQSENILLPSEEIECYTDSDCGNLVYCPDGTAFKEWACVKYKCQEVYYADDPCIQPSELSILEKMSYFFKKFLEGFF